MALAAAMAAAGDARAEVPQALHEATLAAAFRGAAAEAGVLSLAAAVVRGLAVSAAVKAAAIVLAVVSMISAGAGFATLAGRESHSERRAMSRGGGSTVPQPRRRSQRPAVGRMADQPGPRDLQAAGRRLGRDLREPPAPGLEGFAERARS